MGAGLRSPLPHPISGGSGAGSAGLRAPFPFSLLGVVATEQTAGFRAPGPWGLLGLPPFEPPIPTETAAGYPGGGFSSVEEYEAWSRLRRLRRDEEEVMAIITAIMQSGILDG